MAYVSSGSFVTTSSKNRSLTFSWSVDSTNVAANTKTLYWTLTGSGSATGYVKAGNFKITFDPGTTQETVVYEKGQDYRIELWQGTVVASGYTTLSHDLYGNRSFNVRVDAAIYSSARNVSGAGGWDLPAIPRYANVSQSVSNKTETTITVVWQSDQTASYYWYSVNGGSSWKGGGAVNAKSGTYTISGLTAGTSYSIVTRVKRADNSLESNSSGTAVSTYGYPRVAESTQNFLIGDKLKLELYNPLSRPVTVEGIAEASGEVIFSGTTSGTSIEGFDGEESVEKMYNSIPNSTSGGYKVRVKYGTTSTTVYSHGSYSIRGTEVPTISSFGYFDGNDDTVAVTQDATLIVQNLSELYADIQAATPNCGAGSITWYNIECNGELVGCPTPTQYSMGTVGSAADIDMTLTAFDSRGLTATKTVKVKIAPYQPPTATATLHRLNNYEDTTYLTVNASISSVNGKNTATVQYRYKSTGEYGEYTTIQNNVEHTVSLDKNYAFTVEVKVTDAFGKTFTAEYALGKGVFPLFIDTRKNAVGINDFPATGEALRAVGGSAYFEKAGIGETPQTGEALRVTGGIAHFVNGVHIGNENLADFIIEQGTQDGWTYRKWHSGILEQWGRFAMNVGSWKGWGNVYESEHYIASQTYAVTFVGIPVVNATLNTADFGGWLEIGGVSTETTTPEFFVVRPLNNVDVNAWWSVNIYAIGKWK